MAVSLGVLMSAAPLMILSAIAIKLSSRGPIFYCSERIGIDGTPFKMIKFRTMVVDADKQVERLGALNEFDGGVLFKIRQDPSDAGGPYSAALQHRRTAAVLQRVEERDECHRSAPPLRCEVDAYTEQVRRRLLVLPGITGLWQVSGRADLSWDDSVRLDLSYVENWSISGDVLIAFKTIRTVLGGVGAY